MKIKRSKNLPNSVCENSNLTSSLSFSVRALSRRICSFSSSDSSVCIFILKSVISRSCRSFSSLRSFSARSRCSRSCRYRLFIFRKYFLKSSGSKKMRGNAKVLFCNRYTWWNFRLLLLRLVDNCVESIYKTQKS